MIHHDSMKFVMLPEGRLPAGRSAALFHERLIRSTLQLDLGVSHTTAA